MNALAQTGTSDLLKQLSDYLDDDCINELFPRRSGVGRPSAFTAAQLFRVSLLTLLTPVHSFNLLLKILPENRSWRRFAKLPNRFKVPLPKMLHDFRDQLDLNILREVNSKLLRPLLTDLEPSRKTVSIMDSTDLAASCFKKTNPVGPPNVPPWVYARQNQEPVAGSLATRSTP
jgi:hypothetical protein